MPTTDVGRLNSYHEANKAGIERGDFADRRHAVDDEGSGLVERGGRGELASQGIHVSPQPYHTHKDISLLSQRGERAGALSHIRPRVAVYRQQC
jgi:hypothetical protein